MIRGFFYKFNRSFKNLQNVILHVKLLSPTLILISFQDHPYLSRCFLPISNQPFLIPCPLLSLNQLLSLKIASFLHSPDAVTQSASPSATSKNTNREPDEANDALNSNCNDGQPKTNREIAIAGDSLLHQINSRRMMVNKILSVKLTKRGDSLSGTVSRLTTFISKHSKRTPGYYSRGWHE